MRFKVFGVTFEIQVVRERTQPDLTVKAIEDQVRVQKAVALVRRSVEDLMRQRDIKSGKSQACRCGICSKVGNASQN